MLRDQLQLATWPHSAASYRAVDIGPGGKMATASASPFKTREQRAADREAKREAVIRAAVRMFNERGFHTSTFDDVAASLGVSKPTIYHYLGNKEEVLLECVSRGISELKDAAAQAAEEPGSGLDRLRAFLVRYVQINMDDFGRCVIRTLEEGLTTDSAAKFRALKREVDNALRAMITEAMDDGSIAKGNVKVVAFTLAGALNWPARWYRPDADMSPEDLAVAMVDLLIQGIKQGNG
jgi:AcrR family transcriptional regulator